MIDNIIPNGTEVLIFKFVDVNIIRKTEENYIKGIIKNSEIMEYPVMYGSPYERRIYTVIGEDKKEYYGTYGFSTTDYYFMTTEDYTKKLQYYISENNNKINNLKNQNNSYNQIINDLRNDNSNVIDNHKHKVLVKTQN